MRGLFAEKLLRLRTAIPLASVTGGFKSFAFELPEQILERRCIPGLPPQIANDRYPIINAGVDQTAIKKASVGY